MHDKEKPVNGVKMCYNHNCVIWQISHSSMGQVHGAISFMWFQGLTRID